MVRLTLLRIENQITSEVALFDLDRDPGDVFFELACFVRRVNHRRRKGPRGSVHLRENGVITLRWHDPYVDRFICGTAPELRPEEKQAPAAEALTELVARAIRNGRPGEAQKKTRIRIVNDITGQTAILESQRSRAKVYLDLCQLVRQTNGRRDDMLRATVTLTRDVIGVRWFCPWVIARNVAAEMVALVAPIHAVEQILWPRPSQDVAGVGQ